MSTNPEAAAAFKKAQSQAPAVPPVFHKAPAPESAPSTPQKPPIAAGLQDEIDRLNIIPKKPSAIPEASPARPAVPTVSMPIDPVIVRATIPSTPTPVPPTASTVPVQSDTSKSTEASLSQKENLSTSGAFIGHNLTGATYSPAPIPEKEHQKDYETDPDKAIHQSSLRTYSGDVSDVITHHHISTASMVMAEQKKKELERMSPTPEIHTMDSKTHIHGEGRGELGLGMMMKPNQPANNVVHGTATFLGDAPAVSRKKLWISIASVVLIIIGLGGAYYLYSQSPLAAVKTVTPVATQSYSSMIPSDSVVAVPIDGLSTVQALSAIRAEIAKPSKANTIKEIIVTETKNGKKMRAPSADMIKLLGISAPDILARTLTDDWMIGVYADPNNNKDIFVIATQNLYQNAFAGMLAWEGSIANDLKQILYITPPISSSRNIEVALDPSSTTTNPVSSTTASTATLNPPHSPTQYEQQFFTPHGHFVDGIVKSKDTREFLLDDGQTLFIYSLFDNSRIIMAGREPTISEILSRLERETFVR